MNLDFNTSWVITWPEIAGALAFLTMAGWVLFGAYWKVMARFDTIEERMEGMEQRNSAADVETAHVKVEQQRQHTDIAVMAADMRGVTASLARIEAAVGSLRGDPRT
jgi:hypothetical protein